jgi:hypothetical protein
MRFIKETVYRNHGFLKQPTIKINRRMINKFIYKK